jgi:hypothetical protein
MDARSPATIGGTPVSMLLYFQDCDAAFARAVSVGAKVLRPVQDQFYGDRAGTVADPFGPSGPSPRTRKTFPRGNPEAGQRRSEPNKLLGTKVNEAGGADAGT